MPYRKKSLADRLTAALEQEWMPLTLLIVAILASVAAATAHQHVRLHHVWFVHLTPDVLNYGTPVGTMLVCLAAFAAAFQTKYSNLLVIAAVSAIMGASLPNSHRFPGLHASHDWYLVALAAIIFYLVAALQNWKGVNFQHKRADRVTIYAMACVAVSALIYQNTTWALHGWFALTMVLMFMWRLSVPRYSRDHKLDKATVKQFSGT
ncbi:MAG TPA: hypothetical protein VFT49_00635 [Candidatus Saccharimonadales bacterium]|nr:hypothetical protein [Candidatus Saccharimonadales bacterium]